MERPFENGESAFYGAFSREASGRRKAALPQAASPQRRTRQLDPMGLACMSSWSEAAPASKKACENADGGTCSASDTQEETA